MGRGEDRDLLSSGFFDGNNDRPHNKRLTANDSSRKREGGGYQSHSGVLSHTGVMFRRPRNQMHLSSGAGDDSRDSIRASSFTKWFKYEISLSAPTWSEVVGQTLNSEKVFFPFLFLLVTLTRVEKRNHKNLETLSGHVVLRVV